MSHREVNTVFPDINLALASERIVFGASLAYHGDSLFTVAGLEPGSTAHLMGVKNGDQILRINGTDVLTQADLTYVLDGKRPGDSVEVELIRDGETVFLLGTIPPGERAYRRDLMTGSLRARAEANLIDVEVRHVGKYTLLISSSQFDLSEPIIVTTNGTTSFSDVVEPDIHFMLEQAAADLDRTIVYEAKIEIIVGPAAQ